MGRATRGFSIRSFRDGDEAEIARAYNDYAAKFFGPASLTGKSWRSQFRKQGWTGPSVEGDRDCVRIFEQEGKLLGYAVTHYRPTQMAKAAIIQELCVVPGSSDYEGALEIMQALIEDAEARARERGKTVVLLQLSPEDGLALAAAAASGYETRDDLHGVFMATIIDLTAFLSEAAEELTRRLRGSEFRDWSGTMHLSSGELSCTVETDGGAVGRVTPCPPGPGRDPGSDTGFDISAEIMPEALPLLLMGRRRVAELYLQDALGVKAADRGKALRLLDTLFPRVPIYLPRAQWW